jgi:hypothetical protein
VMLKLTANFCLLLAAGATVSRSGRGLHRLQRPHGEVPQQSQVKMHLVCIYVQMCLPIHRCTDVCENASCQRPVGQFFYNISLPPRGEVYPRV